MEHPFLEVLDVTRTFVVDEGLITVLDSVCLTVNRGEVVGLVGASGAGKTTLLHSMGGLDRPTSGKVLYDGVDIIGMDETRLARFRSWRIGYVFQAHMLLPEFNAIENVALPAMIAGKSKKEALELAGSLLAKVGLSHRVTHRPGKLSGGEQQRVAIARALVNEPDLMLADEPTGNLDTKTGDEVFDLLMDLNRETGTAFVVVTHNPALMKRMEKVVRIKDGKIVDFSDDMLE